MRSPKAQCLIRQGLVCQSLVSLKLCALSVDNSPRGQLFARYRIPVTRACSNQQIAMGENERTREIVLQCARDRRSGCSLKDYRFGFQDGSALSELLNTQYKHGFPPNLTRCTAWKVYGGKCNCIIQQLLYDNDPEISSISYVLQRKREKRDCVEDFELVRKVVYCW